MTIKLLTPTIVLRLTVRTNLEAAGPKVTFTGDTGPTTFFYRRDAGHMLMSELPPLHDVLSGSPETTSHLEQALSILFEPSPVLVSNLIPQLKGSPTLSSTISSYSELIDTALAVIAMWDSNLQAEFISGHPRIGEHRKLSVLSAKEQGVSTGASATPPEVLLRLSHLNACYERKYPGLRYITFVNGRSRAAIAEEMEDILKIRRSLAPDQPELVTLVPVKVDGDDWKAELTRAVIDVGLIAKSRLKVFKAS